MFDLPTTSTVTTKNPRRLVVFAHTKARKNRNNKQITK